MLLVVGVSPDSTLLSCHLSIMASATGLSVDPISMQFGLTSGLFMTSRYNLWFYLGIASDSQFYFRLLFEDN